MPKLIVYVKAETWKKVEAGYGLDAPALMRSLSVEAIEEFLNGKPPERDQGRQDSPATEEVPQERATSVAVSAPVPRSRSCPMNPPRGTKCKVCGKVHPL